MTIIINTRADLEALKGTPDYLPALRTIAGTIEMTVNTAEYPEGYVDVGYNGPEIEPTWTKVETLETIHLLGFASRAEFDAEYAAATAEAG
jgi:hypothetical protein